MSSPNPPSLSAEEALARMVSLAYMPKGFSVRDLTSAFLEVAEVDHENARSNERELQAIRANVCEARHALAEALSVAMDFELSRGADSMLNFADATEGIQRVTVESLSEWANDQFGIGALEWESWNQSPANDGMRWENVTIKIYRDYRLGVKFENGKLKRSSFRDIGLMGLRKSIPNDRGGILIGLSKGEKFPTRQKIEHKDKTAVSKLRYSLSKLTGLQGDPFRTFNEADGWKPRFKLIDDRRNADERAKSEARHESLDETRNYADENDDAADWLSKNS
jgi:hypothetical protein